MSLGIYCVMCGLKHEYTLSKPRFCQSCGHSLDGKASTAERKTVVVDEPASEPLIKKLSYADKLKQRLSNRGEDDETEIEEDNFIPKAGKLEINVVSRRKEVLGDLAVGAKVDREPRRESGQLVFKNQKQFERDFKKLAGKARE